MPDAKRLRTHIAELDDRRRDLSSQLAGAAAAVEEAEDGLAEGEATVDAVAGAQTTANALKAALAKVEGRLSSAKANLQAVEEETRKKKALDEAAAVEQAVEAKARFEAAFEKTCEALRTGSAEMVKAEAAWREAGAAYHRHVKDAGEDPKHFHIGNEARCAAHGSPRGGGMGGVNLKAGGSQLKDAVIGQYRYARQRK